MTPEDKKYTVLIVDDNPSLVKLLTQSLSALTDFRAIGVENGADALVRYFDLEPRPDCVVIDIRMPGLDGYQLVRALRGDTASAKTPLIILSALAQDKDQLGGMLSGADRYLIKPVTPLELIDAIRAAMRLDEQERTERLRALAEAAEESEDS